MIGYGSSRSGQARLAWKVLASLGTVALLPALAWARAEDVAKPAADASAHTNASAHWAFQPVRRPTVPIAKDSPRVQTPVDAFLLAELEAHGRSFAPRADARTLVRRVTFDLTGLPPSPGEVESFERDPTQAAFARVVERLLASPRYGERWGRHWLDVARYADTKGYVYSDREEKRFVHSHAYRDWVIRAFNDDLQYDQFLLKQIAADQLLTSATNSDPDLAALGFFTVGRRFLGVQHDIIDDRIDVLCRGTMGLSVSCARCHDHKYDPVTMHDYYALYGVFASCREETVALEAAPTSKDGEEFAKGLREREAKLQATFEAKRAALTERLRARAGEYLAAVLGVAKLPSEVFYTIMGPNDLNPVIVRQWDAYLFKTRRAFHPLLAPWHQLAELPGTNFEARAAERIRGWQAETDPDRRVNPLVLRRLAEAPLDSMKTVAARYGKLFADVDASWRAELQHAQTNQSPAPVALDAEREPIRQILYGADSPANVPGGAVVDLEWFFDEPSRIELAKAQKAIDEWLLRATGAPPHAVILGERAAPRNARVFQRGNPAQPREEVPRQFLASFSRGEVQPFRHGSGRLELARAIASADNPLTARVWVNRVWQHHFGAGLVRTPSDFGMRAEPPSHPALLDWLASQFVARGWSIKELHRLIVLSAAYQQSSDALDDASLSDPENRLLSRMNKRRLDFESLRDSLLAVSGELDLTLGGRSVELFGKPFSLRRSVYGFVDRQFLPGVYRAFDFANPDLHIPQRSETTVPQQALFLLNHPFTLERARALARHVVEAVPSENPEADAQRIRACYRQVFQRAPTDEQLAAGVEFIRTAESNSADSSPALSAWEKFAQVLLLSNEFAFVD